MKKFTLDDHAHLQWIYDRLVNHHLEDENVDFMVKFKAILDNRNPTVSTSSSLHKDFSDTSHEVYGVEWPPPHAEALLPKEWPPPHAEGTHKAAICPTCRKILSSDIELQYQHYKEHITYFWDKINKLIEAHG